MIGRDLLAMIKNLINEETLYFRHWLAQVVDDQDSLNEGRVKVIVPELGYMTADQGMWAFPRMGNRVEPPRKNDWVEVYFMGGDKNRPVYLTGVWEIAGQVPSLYSTPKKKVIWENPDNSDGFTYDVDNQVFEAIIGTVDIKADAKNKKLTLTMGGQTIVMDDGAGNVIINGNLEVDK
jgi:hypothetical protein